MHSNWIMHFTIQVLNIRVCFLNIWDTSLTSVHSNLEHGLAILTESFRPLKSELHNLPCWSLNQKSCTKPCYSYLSCMPNYTQLAWGGLNWPQPTKVDTDVILRCEYNVPGTKLNADVMTSGTGNSHNYWDLIKFWLKSKSMWYLSLTIAMGYNCRRDSNP